MRKYILCTLVSVLIATIGCATSVIHNSPEAFNKLISAAGMSTTIWAIKILRVMIGNKPVN